MFGVNADGWLAVHHVAHRELMDSAERGAPRRPRDEVRKPAPAAPLVVSTAPVCC
jgi:hypothetical protein